jgi:hypothetical protein
MTTKDLLMRLAELHQFLRIVSVVDAIECCSTEPLSMGLRGVRQQALACEMAERKDVHYVIGVLLTWIGKLP